jgi:hypothetical protein
MTMMASARFSDSDEFDLRQRDVVRVRQRHQARHVRHARQHLRGGLHQRAAVGRIAAQPALDFLDLLVMQRLELEQVSTKKR